jgi:hypothetical protein
MEGLMRVSQSGKPACTSSARSTIVSLSAAEVASAKMAKAGNAAALVRTERRDNLFILRSSSGAAQDVGQSCGALALASFDVVL